MLLREGSVLCDGPARCSISMTAPCLPMDSLVVCEVGQQHYLDKRERDLELCNPCLSILITSLISLQESNFTVIISLFNPTLS